MYFVIFVNVWYLTQQIYFYKCHHNIPKHSEVIIFIDKSRKNRNNKKIEIFIITNIQKNSQLLSNNNIAK